ncbi:MAG: WG repeat-containing protein [Crocinitomicaceae bacterium]
MVLFLFKQPQNYFGYINVYGKLVIATKYKAVGYFLNGLVWVKNADGIVDLIDNSGKMVIEAKFLAAK